MPTEPALTVEDAIQLIVRYLHEPKPSSETSSYGYGLYLPNVARAYLGKLGKTWQETEHLWPSLSPTFYAAAWELCRRGILRPGVRHVGLQITDDGSGGNGYSVTPYGESWLKKPPGADLPLEPSRFATMLADTGKKFGSGFVERSQEAVRAYQANAFLACCAMCGAAAESIVLVLAVAKAGNEKSVLEMYASASGRGRVENLVLGKQPKVVQEEFHRYTTLLKYWRDSAAHGKAVAITEPEAFSSLALLLRFARFAADRWGDLTT